MLDHSSFASSVVTMDVTVRNVLNLMRLSRREAVAMATINPARFLKVANRKGSLEAGKDADCVTLDENFQVVETIIGGVRVPKFNAGSIASSPLTTSH